MPKLTVEYEIEPNGNCSKCAAFNRHLVAKKYIVDVCEAFGVKLYSKTQCSECKDFLAKEASKVYCDGCKYHDYNKYVEETYCQLKNKTLFDGHDYKINCKQKETE